MRHSSGLIAATLMSLIGPVCAFAADASECTDCTVADAIARASQADEREHSGLHAGGGYWSLSAQIEDLETAGVAGPARLRNDNSGMYLLVDAPRVLSGEAEKDVDLLLRERQVEHPGNPIGEYVCAGILYRSAAVEGWRGQFGVAVGFAELATPLHRALTRSGIGVADREATYVLTYRFELSERFALQSDVQYVRNPGMDASIDSSWAIGLRFEISRR